MFVVLPFCSSPGFCKFFAAVVSAWHATFFIIPLNYHIRIVCQFSFYASLPFYSFRLLLAARLMTVLFSCPMAATFSIHMAIIPSLIRDTTL